MVEMDDAEFDAVVSEALDLVPPDLAAEMDNVVVLVEPDPPDGLNLLGLYEGTPLTERDGWWAAGSLPDRITIYRRPLLAMAYDREDLVEQIVITVIHEIAHHFGISDERLHELGWG